MRPITLAISSLWLKPRVRWRHECRGRGTSTACSDSSCMGAIVVMRGMRSAAIISASGRMPLNLSHSIPRCNACLEYVPTLTTPVRTVSSRHAMHVVPRNRSSLHIMHVRIWGGTVALHSLQYHVPSSRHWIHRAGASASRKPSANSTRC